MQINQAGQGLIGASQITELDRKFWDYKSELAQKRKEMEPQQDPQYAIECLQNQVRDLEFIVDDLVKKMLEQELINETKRKTTKGE